MATINGTSLREEIDRLKSQFQELNAEGKVSGEVKAVMDAMLMIVELMLAIFLERTTKKTSKNSSIPPSQTDKDDTSVSKNGSREKGRKPRSPRVGNTRTKETVTIAAVSSCDNCGDDLSNTPCQGHERRTKIDIVFEKVVEHIDAEIKQCPSCGTTQKGCFPSNLHGPLQYGDGLKAFVINLLIVQMTALKRVQGLIHSMMGELLSEATLLKFVLRLHLALEPWENRAIEQILKEPTIHVDETSFRVNRKKSLDTRLLIGRYNPEVPASKAR